MTLTQPCQLCIVPGLTIKQSINNKIDTEVLTSFDLLISFPLDINVRLSICGGIEAHVGFSIAFYDRGLKLLH